MNLTIQDRLVILAILPTKGNIESLTISYEILDKITITNDEIVKYEINKIENSNEIVFNSNIKSDTDFELTSDHILYIKNLFLEISGHNEMSMLQYKVYKKIENEITNN